MRLGLMLAQRQNRGVPAVGLQAAGVVERQPGVVAELGTRNAVRLVFVIERGPLASEVPLGEGRSAGSTKTVTTRPLALIRVAATVALPEIQDKSKPLARTAGQRAR